MISRGSLLAQLPYQLGRVIAIAIAVVPAFAKARVTLFQSDAAVVVVVVARIDIFARVYFRFRVWNLVAVVSVVATTSGRRRMLAAGGTVGRKDRCLCALRACIRIRIRIPSCSRSQERRASKQETVVVVVTAVAAGSSSITKVSASHRR